MTAGGPARRRVQVIVRGRVQGVAFRAHTADEARRLGLAGWVRNRPDGSVEAVVEGAPEPIDALVAWLRHGPRLARVSELELREEAPRGEQGFAIRH